MIWFRLACGLAVTAALLAAGAKGGQHLADLHAAAVLNECASAIKGQGKVGCPTQISDAIASVTLAQTQTQIEYRDRAIPVIIQGAEDRRQEHNQATQDVSELRAQEKTNACASSPAMRLLREQLRVDAASAP